MTREQRDHPPTYDRRTRQGSVTLRAAADEDDGDQRTLVGHAAVYYREGEPGTEFDMRDWWGFVERIMPGAFDAALEEVRAGEADVLGLYNHVDLLGRTKSGTVRLSTDQRGLAYEIDLGDTTAGRDVREHVSRGDVTGSSFAFRATEERWIEHADGYEIREILSVRLYDVSPVDFPAYEGTDVVLRAGVALDPEVRKRIAKRIAKIARGPLTRDQIEAQARWVEIQSRR